MIFNSLINKTLLKFNLSENDRILIGFSGGPDSVFLCELFRAFSIKYNIKIYLAHMNHKCRFLESDKDELFCKRYAEKYQIPLITKSGKVTQNSNFENAARDKRYNFFSEVMKKRNINILATGHTKDDQVETFFMRLFRGSGLDGLCSISPNQNINGKRIIRPLLKTQKNEILEFLKENRIKYRIDKSNQSNIYYRNNIRHHLIPLIKTKYNHNIENIIYNTSDIISDAYSFIKEKTQDVYKQIALEDKSSICLKISALKRIHKYLRSEIIRHTLYRLNKSLKSFEAKHIKAIDNYISHETGQFDTHLPSKVFVKKHGDTIHFFKRKNSKKPETQKKRYLKISGDTRINNYVFKTSLIRKRPNNFKNKSLNQEYVDFDKTGKILSLRYPKRGDKIKVLGMTGHKLISRIFSDEKIKKSVRMRTPVITAKDKIVSICGLRISEDFKIDSQTKQILKISYETK